MANLDELAVKVTELVEKSLDFDNEMDWILTDTANDIISDIRETAPVGNSKEHLKDSFTYVKEGTKSNRSVTIYSKTKGRIVHLVEFGFVHRSGKFVSARPFLRPSYEKEAPKMEERIKEAIEDAAKGT